MSERVLHEWRSKDTDYGIFMRDGRAVLRYSRDTIPGGGWWEPEEYREEWEELARLAAENKRQALKLRCQESSLTWCPDCRDKVQGHGCQRCEARRLAAEVQAKDAEIERLLEMLNKLVSVAFDPGYNEETRWRMIKEELETWANG